MLFSHPARSQALADPHDVLRASEERFRALVERGSDAVALIDRDGVIRYASSSTAQVLGYAADEFVGRNVFELMHPADLERTRALFQECLARPGVMIRADYRYRHKDGSWRHLEATGVNRLDDPGLGAIVANYRDITERKQGEETQARLAAIVESSHDAIIGETLEGTITTWNSAAERLYGYSAAEAIGRPILITVPQERREEVGTMMARLRRGEHVDVETVRVRKDGSRIDVSLTLSPIRDASGAVIGVSKISRDITQRKRFEEELWRKNVELEVANRAKDSFLASMSHELRTPLNAIIGFTGTLLMKLPGPLTADQERQLQLVRISARHLLSLINDLLHLAKIQSGKAELRPGVVSCRSVVKEVAATLRPSAEERNLTLAVRLPSRDIRLRTDRRSLTQILINLATNAIKYTDAGTVRVEVERRRGGPKPAVHFRVVDTGRGIRDEDRAKLFRPFEQLEPAAGRADSGAGLGLHLSRKLAALLGGDIEVSSEFGRGSTFTLVLPDR